MVGSDQGEAGREFKGFLVQFGPRGKAKTGSARRFKRGGHVRNEIATKMTQGFR
jgi:hypothetical protein